MNTQDYMMDRLKTLTNIPSPTGMTRMATDYVLAELTRLGFTPTRTPKGTVLCELGGNGHPLVISAHVDTLGAIVRAVKPNGCLRYFKIGGYNDTALENENVIIFSRQTGKTFTGTVQSTHASLHVWSNNCAEERCDKSLEVVVDEETWSKEATEALGIRPGDIIAFDPRFTVTPSGFIKSRHLDDKASSAVLLTLARDVAEGRVTLKRKVTLMFTVYEEVGHGASPLYTADVDDLLAVDMGCVGDDLSCHENMVSICASDGAGPYDYDFTNELIDIARTQNLPYAVDIYPRYSSDTATALKGGLDARFALCGQGVYASHAYERTHVKGMMATLALVTAVAQK